MSNLETDGSPQLELARSYFQGAQKRNIDQIAKTMHKGFIRVTHPRSAGRPAQSREEYLQTLGDLIGLWTEDAQFIFHSVIEIFEKVVFHITVTANTSIGVGMVREVIWTGHIVTDEDGSLKFKQVEEFTDSKTYLDFFKAVVEAKAKKEYSASYAA